MDRETFHSCSPQHPPPQHQHQPHFIDYIEREIPYSRFFRSYLLANLPCVFSSSFTEHWNCRKHWVTADGKPDLQRLLHDFDEAPVPVANCSAREFNANPKQTLPLRDFLSYWREHMQNGHSSPRGCLYLKDWHMQRNFTEHNSYTTPVYFSSDWLNEYWEALEEEDDYRFVYMGPKGSWTPFHADVLRSYSWSANVCGRKKWLLYPPGQEEFLRDRHGNLAYDVTALDAAQRERACQPLEVIQEAGEILFVPSGWHHQVYNLEDTISINHNWLNGCNVERVWRFLRAELGAVQREVQEWRQTMDTWHQHCQVILKSCTGMDYLEFLSFLKTIASNRISFLNSCPRKQPSESLRALGPHHATFDLQRVLSVCESVLGDEDFGRLDLSALSFKPEELLQEVRDALVKNVWTGAAASVSGH